MRIGVCADIEKARIIKERGIEGIDYIEENMSNMLALSDREFAGRQREYEKLALPVYSFNVFFSSEIPIYSDEFLRDAKEYGRKAFSRAVALGGELCVVGSGKARNIPDESKRAFCEKRFENILTILGEEADRYGIKLAVEPLNKGETNFINSVVEGADMAKRVGLACVGSLVDFYHFFKESESDEALLGIGDSIIHSHIAAPDVLKRMPEERDLPTIEHWAGLLKRIGFTKTISIECRYTDFGEEMIEKLKYLEPFRKL